MKLPSPLGLGLVASAAAVVGVWLCLHWLNPSDDAASGAASAQVPTPNRDASAAPPAPATAATAATAKPDRPAGVSAQQWDALAAEMRERPDGPAELRRLGGYFEWSDVLRRFRAARGSGTADLASLAQTLDQGLLERLQRAEVSAAEALQIKRAILEATRPDPAAREKELQQWAATAFPPATVDPRQAVFEQRQSEIVAAWSALPAPARDRSALERDLDSLRRQSFSSGAR